MHNNPLKTCTLFLARGIFLKRYCYAPKNREYTKSAENPKLSKVPAFKGQNIASHAPSAVGNSVSKIAFFFLVHSTPFSS